MSLLSSTALGLGLIVDSFAGGGGASTGIEAALGAAVDIAINHDEQAIRMHEANHPGTVHVNSNIWQVDPVEVVRSHPSGVRHVSLAWFSPDCKHFSKAKGGKPREKSIRDLAWVVVLWAQRVQPDVILLENVEEFRTWGPLCDEGKPIKERQGETFNKWTKELRKAGYKIQWKELRACDYGAPTIRKRFFMIARRDGKPIVWPAPTHGKPGSLEVLSGKLKPWRSAAEIIDWSIPCPSIFERSKPLADKTLRRIAHGIMKFV
ncbi:MAG: DNA cytosine methyltransferase, partial [Novosphingobium sp.]